MFDSEPGAAIVPNPDLARVRLTMEGSIEKVFHDRLRLRGNAYYTLLDNATVRRPFSERQDSIPYDGELSRVDYPERAQATVVGFVLALTPTWGPAWRHRPLQLAGRRGAGRRQPG